MNNMRRVPGFTADASAYGMQRSYRSAIAAPLPQVDGRLVPQQWENCADRHGICTGILTWYRGRQCVTGLSGYRQCCTVAGTWPYIRECPVPGGGWEVAEASCKGPCV